MGKKSHSKEACTAKGVQQKTEQELACNTVTSPSWKGQRCFRSPSVFLKPIRTCYIPRHQQLRKLSVAQGKYQKAEHRRWRAGRCRKASAACLREPVTSVLLTNCFSHLGEVLGTNTEGEHASQLRMDKSLSQQVRNTLYAYSRAKLKFFKRVKGLLCE